MLNEKEVLQLLTNHNIVAETREVTKNNNVVLHGISLGTGNIKPTLYLEDYTKLDDLLIQAIKVLENVPEFDSEKFRDWNFVKNKLRVKLSGNPNVDLTFPGICDLKATVYVKIADNMRMDVRKCVFDEYGQSYDYFYKKALENTAEYEGAELIGLGSLIDEYIGNGVSTYNDVDFCMHVLTNRSRIYGASALLYFDGLPNKFYMLPSSVHEVILIYPVGVMEPDNLSTIVREVNASQLLPEEVLSDHAYYFEDGWKLSI